MAAPEEKPPGPAGPFCKGDAENAGRAWKTGACFAEIGKGLIGRGVSPTNATAIQATMTT